MAIVIEEMVNKHNPTQSICWDCHYTLKCDWILNKKRIWRKALEKRKYYAHENKEYVSYLVVACDHFEFDLNLSSNKRR